jgi:hypothetical protein
MIIVNVNVLNALCCTLKRSYGPFYVRYILPQVYYKQINMVLRNGGLDKDISDKIVK